MDPLAAAAVAVVVVATLYAFARRALLSLTYAIAVLAIYALQVLAFQLFWSGAPVAPFLWQELGLAYGSGTLPLPWTWVTFQFVHGSETHLLLNLMGFVFISPVFEERVGSARWAVLFLAGGAFGALVFIVLSLNRSLPLVGASAGLFSIFAAYGRLFPRERIRLFLPLPGLPALPVLQVVIGFLVLEMLLGLIGPRGIAWEAHAGGLAFGLAAAPAVRRLPLGRSRTRKLAPLDGLRELATTAETRSWLEEAERADLPEVRDAWIEKLVASARCPKCGGALRKRLGTLRSDCGWSRRMG